MRSWNQCTARMPVAQSRKASEALGVVDGVMADEKRISSRGAPAADVVQLCKPAIFQLSANLWACMAAVQEFRL